jgi:hypothetical protein
MPMHVAGLLIRRAAARGQLTDVGRNHYVVDRSAVDAAPDFADKRASMMARTTALADKVVAYARDVQDVEWTLDDAYRAIEQLCEEFEADLALARRLRPEPRCWVASTARLSRAPLRGSLRSALTGRP